MNEEQLKVLKEMIENQIEKESESKKWHNISIVLSIADELGIEIE